MRQTALTLHLRRFNLPSLPAARCAALSRVMAVAILLLSATLMLHGIVQTLPYQLNPDEPVVFNLAEWFRTLGELSNYSRPRIILLTGQHILLNLVTPGQVDQPVYFFFGRVSNVWIGLLLLAATYQAGRWLHSRAAGLAAMTFLAAQPDAVTFAKTLKTDNLSWLLGMLCLLGCAYALRAGRRTPLLLAALAGAVAVYNKYTMLPLLLLPAFLLAAWAPRRSLWRAAALGALAAAAVGGILLVLDRESVVAGFLMRFHGRQLYERESIVAFVSLRSGWHGLLAQIGPLNLWGTLIAIPLGALGRRRDRLPGIRWALIGLLTAVMVSTVVLLGLFQTNRVQDRYVAVLAFALLWGLALGLLIGQRPVLTLAAALALTLPWIGANWRAGSEMMLPDTRALTADWFIASTPEGTHIAVEKDHVEFDRNFGGFPSTRIYVVEEIDSVYERSLEDFARAGVEYLVADYRNIYRGGYFAPENDSRAFLSEVETVLDLTRPWDRGWQGPERYVFHVPPIQQHPMHVFLGEAVIFKGYDLPSAVVVPGETLALTLYWSALRETDANFIVYAHLLPPAGEPVAQLDGPPGDALHRTYDWLPGYFDWDEWPIPIPPDAAPGQYTLRIGMYDADTLARLPVIAPDGSPLGDGITLAEITIARP